MTYVSAAEKQEIDPVSQNHQKLDTTVQTLTTKLTDLNKDRTPTTDATIEKQVTLSLSSLKSMEIRSTSMLRSNN